MAELFRIVKYYNLPRYIHECQNIPGLEFEVRKRWLWKDYVNGHFLLRIEEPPNLARSEAGPSVQWALRNKQITCKTWSIVEVPLGTLSCLQLWPKTMSLLQQDLFRFGMVCQKRPRHVYYIIRKNMIYNTHRIHVCYIWSHLSSIYTPFMLAYIPAPWIRHGMYKYEFKYSPLTST